MPSVRTVGTPYSLDLTSKTRPEMTAEYMILSFPLDNMTGCPALSTKYLENNLILLRRKRCGIVGDKNIQQSKGTELCILHHSQDNLGPNSVNVLTPSCAGDSERYLTKQKLFCPFQQVIIETGHSWFFIGGSPWLGTNQAEGALWEQHKSGASAASFTLGCPVLVPMDSYVPSLCFLYRIFKRLVSVLSDFRLCFLVG